MLLNGEVCEELNKDEAIRLHRQMWSDMADEEKAMGKTFSPLDRSMFKRDWLQQRGYSQVEHRCFLCEYAKAQEEDWELKRAPYYCQHCPLYWKKLVPPEQITAITKYDGRYGTCIYHVATDDELWTVAAIEDIANLPEKE